MLLLAVLVSVAIACDGPCVRFLSSDFDLRLAFASHTVSPDVYSGGCDCMHKCVQACPLGLSAKLCDHMCTPQCSRHCGEEPFGH